jgi:hypothetical protein
MIYIDGEVLGGECWEEVKIYRNGRDGRWIWESWERRMGGILGVGLTGEKGYWYCCYKIKWI